MARRRRKPPEEANNHERWIVSYADFVTLLFAFFVVMYSISSVNEGKYKTLSESLDDAFSNRALQGNVLEPIQTGTLPTVIQPIPLDHVATAETDKRQALSEEILKERKRLQQVSGQLEAVLRAFIDDNLVSVKRSDYWIELEMNSELLFSSGEAKLSKKAISVLKKTAEVIKPLPNAINVEGHTDTIPIATMAFPSNWELSSARATRVVQELIKAGIEPARLSATGYGEFHPIGDNRIEEGRFKNRRVVLLLVSQAFARYGASDAERAKWLNLAPSAAAAVSKP